MLKIVLTGSDGMVGSRTQELLQKKIQFIPLTQSDMDITDKKKVFETLKVIEYDMILHFAAYTNVDGAETHKNTAYAINVSGTENIFEAVSAKKKKMIYISTGFVFDGKTPPFTEKSTPQPLSFYGETKFQGEQCLNGNAMIIRFDYPYRNEYEKKKDFVRGIISALKEGKKLAMVTNSLITPTFVDDIAHGLDFLIHHYSPEIFHLGGGNSVSPYEAAVTIAGVCNLNRSLISGTSYEEYYKNKAQRPQYAAITSLKNNFFKMKSFEEGLRIIYH